MNQLSDFLNLGNDECNSITFWTGEGHGGKSDLTMFVYSLGEEDRDKIIKLLKEKSLSELLKVQSLSKLKSK